jgi:transcriptional regulator with XRE-family HTH domain
MLRWRVKEVAEAKGVNVKELAQRSGVSPSTIRRLYRKPFHYTKVMTWAKLAKALEVPRSAILEERLLLMKRKNVRALFRKEQASSLESRRRSCQLRKGWKAHEEKIDEIDDR